MNHSLLKRIGAYLIDLFIISMLVTLISNINFLNPYKDKYSVVVQEYMDYYDSNFGNVTTIDTDDLLNEEYAEYMYKLNRYAISNTLIEGVVIILYCTLFPRFNNNQTIGKRLFKIKVVSMSSESVPLWKHFVRAILFPVCVNVVIYNSVTTALNVSTLFIFKNLSYLYANLIISYIMNIICYADLITALVRKDHRSLRDLICKTKVVEAC